MIHKLVLILSVVATASALIGMIGKPAKPFDCPNRKTYASSQYSICLSPDKYEANDLESAQAYCQSFGSSLCSLGQMASSWRHNYYDERWGMYNVKGRDARVTPCRTYTISSGECYTSTPGFATGNRIIPNTPRPNAQQKAYCCS
uniref:Cyclin B binding protein n=1 Tax=Marthasterias glacialis TaxID=7609 RepID=Q8IFU0_MARGL|nr:Cyclin B binding protein [Marthasterias glacialis]